MDLGAIWDYLWRNQVEVIDSVPDLCDTTVTGR